MLMRCSWSKGDGNSASKDRLRSLQLDMRLREVYETYHSFRRLVIDPENEQKVYKLNDEKASEAHTKAFYASLSNHIDLDNVHLTGHSFGGGTMVGTCLSLYPSPT